MQKKTSSDFEFTVKAHKLMTHEIRDKETGTFIDNKDVFDRFLYAVEPLRKEGRLTAILAQFPYSFHAIKENYNYLLAFKEKVMFNNCHAGKSVKNAIEMLNLIKDN